MKLQQLTQGRLIIIGNGFDLAHNLPTSYKDFINYYWDSLIKKIKQDLISITESEHFVFPY
jgi:hypothetical protein